MKGRCSTALIFLLSGFPVFCTEMLSSEIFLMPWGIQDRALLTGLEGRLGIFGGELAAGESLLKGTAGLSDPQALVQWAEWKHPFGSLHTLGLEGLSIYGDLGQEVGWYKLKAGTLRNWGITVTPLGGLLFFGGGLLHLEDWKILYSLTNAGFQDQKGPAIWGGFQGGGLRLGAGATWFSFPLQGLVTTGETPASLSLWGFFGEWQKIVVFGGLADVASEVTLSPQLGWMFGIKSWDARFHFRPMTLGAAYQNDWSWDHWRWGLGVAVGWVGFLEGNFSWNFLRETWEQNQDGQWQTVLSSGSEAFQVSVLQPFYGGGDGWIGWEDRNLSLRLGRKLGWIPTVVKQSFSSTGSPVEPPKGQPFTGLTDWPADWWLVGTYFRVGWKFD